MANQKDNVLFLCTGNSARSQMGEGLLRQYAGDRFTVYSAGLDPKGVNPYTIRVMDEIGIDVRGHTSDPVKAYMGRMHFRYVITVCSDADDRCPTPLWSNGEKLHWPFDDPAKATGDDDAIMSEFRRVRDAIDARIKAWVAELEPA
jgi:arsenate reductase